MFSFLRDFVLKGLAELLLATLIDVTKLRSFLLIVPKSNRSLYHDFIIRKFNFQQVECMNYADHYNSYKICCACDHQVYVNCLLLMKRLMYR